MLLDADAIAHRIGALTGLPPDRGVAERLLALCRAQLDAARPLLEQGLVQADSASHAKTLRELAHDG